jgi:hypothetical protein
MAVLVCHRPHSELSPAILCPPPPHTHTHSSRLLRAKALECVSLVGMAVGKEQFRGAAADVMSYLAQLQAAGLEADDPTSSYMLQVGGASHWLFTYVKYRERCDRRKQHVPFPMTQCLAQFWAQIVGHHDAMLLYRLLPPTTPCPDSARACCHGRTAACCLSHTTHP